MCHSSHLTHSLANVFIHLEPVFHSSEVNPDFKISNKYIQNIPEYFTVCQLCIEQKKIKSIQLAGKLDI